MVAPVPFWTALNSPWTHFGLLLLPLDSLFGPFPSFCIPFGSRGLPSCLLSSLLVPFPRIYVASRGIFKGFLRVSVNPSKNLVLGAPEPRKAPADQLEGTSHCNSTVTFPRPGSGTIAVGNWDQPLDIQGFIFHGSSLIFVIILASFFYVFAKCRNLQTYCTGQQISRFLAYLCIHFFINFALIFMFFLEPFLDRLFEDVSGFFIQIWRCWAPLGDPRTPQIAHLDYNFGENGEKWGVGVSGLPFWSWSPNDWTESEVLPAPFSHFSSKMIPKFIKNYAKINIQGWIVIDYGSIWVALTPILTDSGWIFKMFGDLLSEFQDDLINDVREILHRFRDKPTNIQTIKPSKIKLGPAECALALWIMHNPPTHQTSRGAGVIAGVFAGVFWCLLLGH